MKKHLLKLLILVSFLSIDKGNLFAQIGTWAKVATNAPHFNMGVMLQLTDGTVICHNTVGGTYGTGWDKLTPNASGSYVNGTWTTIASMASDRLFFSTQVLPNGNVYVAGGEYGAGGNKGEIYNTVTNTWSAAGPVPATFSNSQCIYDGNSTLLDNGNVLEGPQLGPNPSFNCLFYNPSTNVYSVAPNALYNHDEAAWLKLPDSSVLFVGIASTKSNRYIGKTNTWVNDGIVPVNLYDPFGEEAGAAFMLPNGKAFFLGATGHNAIYTPSGNATPGTWTAAADFPTIGGNKMGTTDAPSCMMGNGHILCAASPVGFNASNEFRNPVYFFEYDYTTNTFAQVTSIIPGVGADSLNNISCYQVNMLQLADGNVLVSIDQDAISNEYFVYTPGSGPLAAGKPVINSLYQTTCASYFLTGKVFNGISEGAAYGDDWEMSTNYPLVRLTNGPNVYYARTTLWNRPGVVQTDSLEDTVQFTLPVGLPAGTYNLVVVANGIPSSPITFTTYGVSAVATTNVTCGGGSDGSATATAQGGNLPYTYNWTPSGGTSAIATGLTAGTYTITLTDAIGCTKTASVTITQPPVLTTTTSTTTATCGGSNGSAKATPAGGTTPYTYLWTPTGNTNQNATGLSAGTYTVTVTDTKGCTVTATAVVSTSVSLTVTTSGIVNDKCNGGATGAATANTVGGTAPYTYNWVPGGNINATATGLTAGTYTVTVTDKNGCTGTATATITQPVLLTTTTSTTPATCSSANGTATATPAGGTGAYTYAWVPGGATTATATGLTAGTYTVTVKDANACTVTASAIVTSTGGGMSVTVVNTPVKCNGGATGTATATPSGGTIPYTYAWTPGGATSATASGLTAGTYTITVTDKNGCTATASTIITQPVALTVTTAIVNVKCNGGATGSATATPSGGTVPYTYSWTPSGGTSATASGLTAGTYTITVTDKNGCTATASAIITQPSSLTSLTSTTPTTCGLNNGSATVTPAGGTPAYIYSWAPGGQTAATATGLSAGTYTSTVTDANGCTVTASATVVNSGGGLSVTVTNTSAKCNGSATGTATATPTGGTVPYTYNWTPSGGTSATATGLTAGTYTITVTDKNGCTATASTIVGQPAVLTVSTTGIVNDKCNGGSTGSATETVSGGTPAYTYAWAPGGSTNATASNLSAGTYTLTVTDVNGCTATATATITQPVALTTTTSTVPATCGSSNGSATATPAGGTSAYTYAWAPGGQTAATATGLSAGSYTVTVTDANGCTVTATAGVTNLGGLSATISSVTNVKCNGGATGSITESTAGGTPPYTFSWAPSGGTNATASNLTAGSYTITVTDKNGCTATASATVTQPPVLTVTASNTPVKCNGGATGTATATPAGGTVPYTYSWTPGGQTSAAASALTAGTYTITVTDKNGCTATASTIVTQPTVLTANISASTNVTCNGGNNGSATVTAGGGTVAYTYNWTPSGGTNNTTTALTAGTYTATVTDANGCTATAAVVITQPPAMTVSPSAPVICSGGNVILTASGAVTYSWSPATGLSATVGASVTASPTVTTLYTVTGTAGACISTATVLVTVNPTPVITLTPPSSNLCSGDSLTIMASGASTYTWAPAAGLSNTVGLIVTAFPAVTTTYTVTGTSNGCSGTATVTITVTPTPTVTVNPSSPAPICSGGNVSLTASGAATYSWSPATGLSATIGATVTASPTVTTSYTVTGTNGSCSNTATVVVTVNPTPTVTVTPAAASICTGGSGTNLTASGAATYTWAPAAGLSATVGSSVTANPAVTTTYTVTGTSGSCSSTQMVTITVNPTPTVTVLPSSGAICSGKSVSLTASGAATYSWAPSAGLSATVGATVTASPTVTTSYTVTGTNGSCTGTAVVLISVSPTPTVVVSPSAPSICATGPGVTLTASGAAGYNWSPATGLSGTSGPVVTATPTITTTYTIVGTSPTGCQDTAKVTVTVDSAIVAAITGKDTICAGDSTTLTASGGGTYTWNTGSTNASITVAPSSNISYSVTVKVGGCSVSTSVNVVVNKAAVINIIQTGDTLKCTPTGLSYQWYKGNTIIPGSTFDSLITHATGTYKVYVTNSSGCSDTGIYVVTGFAGIGEVSMSENINIYPNPTTGNVQIECNIPEGDYTMNMTDVLGQVLFSEKMHVKGVYTKTMNMYNYSSGVYILSIRGENTMTEKKIILNK
jgi:hypothetical protein